MHEDSRDGGPGSALLAAFTHARHACAVCVLPAGGHSSCLPDEICVAIGAPPGTPLPRLVSHELQHPGRVSLYVHEGHRPEGSAFCVSALYVYEVAVRGAFTHSALERHFHANFTIFKAYSTSGGSALLLRPIGGDVANAGLLAVLNLTAIQLAAGFLPAETLRALRSGPLGIPVRGAAASRAFPSAELLRRAASSVAAHGGVGDGGGVVPAAHLGGRGRGHRCTDSRRGARAGDKRWWRRWGRARNRPTRSVVAAHERVARVVAPGQISRQPPTAAEPRAEQVQRGEQRGGRAGSCETEGQPGEDQGR